MLYYTIIAIKKGWNTNQNHHNQAGTTGKLTTRIIEMAAERGSQCGQVQGQLCVVV
jgi:hypothetical protein